MFPYPPAAPGEAVPGGPLRSPEEVRRWAHERRLHEREEVPRPGERLLFREQEFGEPVPAVVTEVQDITGPPGNHWNRHGGLEQILGPGEPDPNVWEWSGRLRKFRLRQDPWPWVRLQIVLGTGEDGKEILASPQWCKEARVRGSTGWLRAGSRAHTGNYETGE